MVGKFDSFLNKYLQVRPDGKALQIATAALLVEIMAVDDHIDDTEREKAVSAIADYFSLDAQTSTAILQLAEKSAAHTDADHLARLLNEALNFQQKTKIIEYLWQIVYADNKIEAYEEAMILQIAKIFNVPSEAYRELKLKAELESRQRLKEK